jgi:hypothetical protein
VAFTLDDLERFVRAVENDYVREGLPQRLEVARISGLFGANVVTGFIKATLEDRGATYSTSLKSVIGSERQRSSLFWAGWCD